MKRLMTGQIFGQASYPAVGTGNLTDEMVQAYIEQQEGDHLHDDSRFVIDNSTKLPPSRR